MPNNPVISTIIPTRGNRSKLLKRSIISALECQGQNVEVVVVLNGETLTSSNVQSLINSWAHDNRVKISAIEKQNACIARNRGYEIAQGQYIRFLDDDDILLPNAYQQIKDINSSGADVSVGAIDLIMEDGFILNSLVPPNAKYLTDLMLLHGGNIALPHAFLFKRQAIKGTDWDENISFSQNKAWLHQLIRTNELKLSVRKESVGQWLYHDKNQLSIKPEKNKQLKFWTLLLIDTLVNLQNQQRLTEERQLSGVDLLWLWIKAAYNDEPDFWVNIANIAIENAPAGWSPQA